MVHLQRVKVKKHYYYRLVHNLRKQGKITHKIKYIGKEKPSKARLKILKKEFLEEIQEDKYKYIKDVDSIEKKKEAYNKELKQLTELEKTNKLNEFIVRFTYDSSKLSGVDITLRQTSIILKEGLIPKGFKNTRTIRELENHEKGVLAITKYKGTFNIQWLKKLHTILFSGVEDSIAGKTRDELKRNVKIAGTYYIPPKWEQVAEELEGFFKWYKSNNRKLHALELAALVHLKIITMQPFADGNSRLSRLLMNWILWKKNYPPIDIPIEELEDYYGVLDQYQINEKEKPFVEYIIKKYII